MNIADQSVHEMSPGVDYSLTAGLIFAEIMILGHRGDTRAYHIDRHHIERITVAGWKRDASKVASNSVSAEQAIENKNSRAGGEPDQIIVYSRPIPRDGYILLCTGGLWKNMNERVIHDIVLRCDDPQEGCKALISHVKENSSQQGLSVILIHFPPDFGSWR